MKDIWVRATTSFQGLRPGEEVQVDPSDPYIAKLISAGWLVPVKESKKEPEAP